MPLAWEYVAQTVKNRLVWRAVDDDGKTVWNITKFSPPRGGGYYHLDAVLHLCNDRMPRNWVKP